MQQGNQALLYAIYNKKVTSTIAGSHIGSSPSSRWRRDRNAEAGLVHFRDIERVPMEREGNGAKKGEGPVTLL
jgi:hypothetical protein